MASCVPFSANWTENSRFWGDMQPTASQPLPAGSQASAVGGVCVLIPTVAQPVNGWPICCPVFRFRIRTPVSDRPTASTGVEPMVPAASDDTVTKRLTALPL